jgi:hypothetical protein
MRHRYPRAIVVLAVVAIALGAGAVVVRADDDPTLPPVTAQELLASAIEAASRPLSVSGAVSTTLDLGLPELPAAVGSGATLPDALASLTGEQRWKLWSSSDGLRIAHLLPAREQDLVVSRTDAWWWDSQELRAVHLDVTEIRDRLEGRDAATTAGTIRSPLSPTSTMPIDPVALARALMDGLAPCASVSVQGTDRVAGRDAYVLALIPLASDSLVGSVLISIDSQTRVPLRVEVRTSDGDDAPISAGFTSIAFAPVDPAMFRFVPPPGADVREAGDAAAPGDGEPGAAPVISDARSFGSCLGAVVAVRLDGPLPSPADRLLPFAGPLASAIAVDRGDHSWVLAGLVDADALETRAATLP